MPHREAAGAGPGRRDAVGSAPDRALLRCPHCRQPLDRAERSWRCPAGHAFDIARSGYVNLSSGRPVHTGDTPAMLDARTAVLDAGHLDAVTAAVVDACADVPAGAVVDVGAGTGHHLAAVLREPGDRDGVAIDASTAAAKRAARADPRIVSVVADAWAPWPVLGGVAAAVLNVFAPRNLPETARVLVPGGVLVVAVPQPDHLAELVGPLRLLGKAAAKDDRLRQQAAGHLHPLDDRIVRTVRQVDRGAAHALALMGPAGHHRPDELAGRTAALPELLDVTIAVQVLRFRRSGDPTRPLS